MGCAGEVFLCQRNITDELQGDFSWGMNKSSGSLTNDYSLSWGNQIYREMKGKEVHWKRKKKKKKTRSKDSNPRKPMWLLRFCILSRKVVFHLSAEDTYGTWVEQPRIAQKSHIYKIKAVPFFFHCRISILCRWLCQFSAATDRSINLCMSLWVNTIHKWTITLTTAGSFLLQVSHALAFWQENILPHFSWKRTGHWTVSVEKLSHQWSHWRIFIHKIKSLNRIVQQSLSNSTTGKYNSHLGFPVQTRSQSNHLSTKRIPKRDPALRLCYRQTTKGFLFPLQFTSFACGRTLRDSWRHH